MTQWKGVYPAVTTHFKPDQSIDFAATAAHIERLLRAGMHGFIMLGTVGENCSLEPEEKRQVLKLAVDTVKGRVPVLAGVAEYTAALAGRYAVDAKKIGINGLMVLPPMVYKSAPRETLAHFRTVARASDLPIMVYNNPPAYGVDITPEMFAELASEPTIVAIKESSDDPRRLTDIINATGNRYTLFCGVDDLILESMVLGCVGWVSGLVNAFPEESVRLYDLVTRGPPQGGPAALSLVHAAAAPGHRPQAGPADQAGAEHGRPGQRTGAGPAPGARRRRARAGPRHRPARPRPAPAAGGVVDRVHRPHPNPLPLRGRGELRSGDRSVDVPSTAERERVRVRVRRQAHRAHMS